MTMVRWRGIYAAFDAGMAMPISRTLAPQTHAVLLTVIALSVTAKPAQAASEIFVNNCAPCHQENGKGVPGSFPSLVGSKVLTGAPSDPIGVVVNGRGKMPPLGDSLDDTQIAEAVSYARSSWNNKAGPVTAADVAAVREASGH